MSRIEFGGRVAIVTGSGGGLGREHVQLLAGRGARVVVNDIVGAEKAAQELRAEGHQAIASADDISSPAGAHNLVSKAVEEFGQLDILINNATSVAFATPAESTPEEYELVRSSGLDSAFYVTCEAWPHMVEQGYGRIVVTTSATGLLGDADAVAYAVAKAGCYGLMRACAHDGAEHGIKVNALAPAAYTRGVVERASAEKAEAMRKMYPTRLVSPAAILLCSEECPVTGRVIDAGGGRVGSAFMAVTAGFYDEEMTPESLLESWPLPIDQKDWRFYESGREAQRGEREEARRRAGLPPGEFLPRA